MVREQKAKELVGTTARVFPKIYAGRYTRCDYCGIYDRNPRWCTLCGRGKNRAR